MRRGVPYTVTETVRPSGRIDYVVDNGVSRLVRSFSDEYMARVCCDECNGLFQHDAHVWAWCDHMTKDAR